MTPAEQGERGRCECWNVAKRIDRVVQSVRSPLQTCAETGSLDSPMPFRDIVRDAVEDRISAATPVNLPRFSGQLSV